MTLSNRCCHDICGICFWQDDGSDDIDANESCLEPNNIDAITGERIEWLTFLENKQYPFECAKLETLDALIEADSPHTA
jgi:hypothetical protein